jgi:hypothetical protein
VSGCEDNDFKFTFYCRLRLKETPSGSGRGYQYQLPGLSRPLPVYRVVYEYCASATRPDGGGVGGSAVINGLVSAHR